MNNEFMETIAPHFDDIKKKFKKNIEKMNLEFNEDIFSQTIENCNKKLHNVSEDDAVKYLWKAFRNNTLRELQYLKNKNTINKILDDVIQTDYEVNEDFNEISKLIINKFGDELYQLFALHANGKPYRELEKMSIIRNLKYKFRRIREYVKKHYKL